MALPSKTVRNYVWLAWFCIQVPIIFCVDAVNHYPAWLVASEDSPLHVLHRFQAWYVATYNDPLVHWSAVTHPRLSSGGGSWVPLFFGLEFFFAVPTVLYALYHLAGITAAARRGRSASPDGTAGTTGTTGPLELLLLVYALEVMLTTAVCINDVAYWDPAVYSPAQKNIFRFQLFGPWFALPALMFCDMYSRLLERFDTTTSAKKTQ